MSGVQMRELSEHELAAAEGAHKMDEFDPKWFEKIEVENLDVGSVLSCIDAQTQDEDDNFYKAASLQKLGVRNEDAHLYGFSATSPHLYGELNAAWKREILQRREGQHFGTVPEEIDVVRMTQEVTGGLKVE